jgi:cytochrome c biogenesis protein CcmG, thiol:disulfide interchange protein DsbE
MSQRKAQRGRPPSKESTSRTSFVPLALGGGVVLAALLVAVLATQSGPTAPASTSSAQTATPSGAAASGAISGDPLPHFVAGQDDPAIGQPAPLVRGAAFDGTPVAIEANGKPKLIVFLAHWCPHCQREVPLVQEWLRTAGLPSDVEFLSVATSSDPSRPNYPPDAWLEREGWSVPVIVDDDDRIAEAYGLSAFPYWAAVGGDGRVVGRLTGELPVSDIEAILDRLAP